MLRSFLSRVPASNASCQFATCASPNALVRELRMPAWSSGVVVWRGLRAYCAAVSAPGRPVSSWSCEWRTPSRPASPAHWPVSDCASALERKLSRWLSLSRFCAEASSESTPAPTLAPTLAFARTSRRL